MHMAPYEHACTVVIAIAQSVVGLPLPLRMLRDGVGCVAVYRTCNCPVTGLTVTGKNDLSERMIPSLVIILHTR